MLKGWQEICEYCGFSKATLKRWIKTRDFPLLKGHGVRKPLTSRSLIDKWLLVNIESQQNNKKK